MTAATVAYRGTGRAGYGTGVMTCGHRVPSVDGMVTVPTAAPRRTGPPLVLPAAAFVGLVVGSLVLGAALSTGVFPSPYAGPAVIQAYFEGSRTAVRVVGTLQFAAAMPLAVYAAVAARRLPVPRPRPAPALVLAGGLLSAASLGLSGLLSWVLSRDEVVAEPALVRLLHDLVFMTGGPGHVVPLALLVAGIAVPGRRAGVLPRPFAVAGLVVAGCCVLSVSSLLAEPLAVLLPGRVGRAAMR